jgi:hypothetical protein
VFAESTVVNRVADSQRLRSQHCNSGLENEKGSKTT